MIVPIPIPLLRKRRRGGNQAEHLARVVAERTGLCSCKHRALSRRGWWGPRQAQAKISGRSSANRDQRIHRPKTPLVKGRGVLLVDDVSTTTATLSEAARMLLAAGADGG